MTPISRRQFGLASANLVASSFIAGGCGGRPESGSSRDALLTARPSATITTSPAGTQALRLDDARDAFLHLPAHETEQLLPLIVLFHGAGGGGREDWFLHGVVDAATAMGVAILAPDSRGPTWDAIRAEQNGLLRIVGRQLTGFGPDVAFLDRALDRVFATVAVDPNRIAAGGFSDGATYALSLGLINGEFFRHIVAFSPGFLIDGAHRGRPRIFVSHGREDRILPIDRCSRRIVTALEKRGYPITFQEFDGGHEVPDGIARQALRWVLDAQSQPT